MFVAGKYEVIVIGAGHAGIEAALAAARLGCQTLLTTLSLENLACLVIRQSAAVPKVIWLEKLTHSAAKWELSQMKLAYNFAR